jgi:outer membrane protein assembly factor BamA
MSLWTGNSFSWENTANTTKLDAYRPPPWEGARLGGYNRMRGFENNRFSDKSVFYITAEYRATLQWNPFRKSDYLPVAVDWLQIVPFIEAGRVNDTYGLDLLKDMKFDAGISLRAMAAQTPVRLDVAYSNEGVKFWVMVFQPFDF